jgi:hypothetical protein
MPVALQAHYLTQMLELNGASLSGNPPFLQGGAK